MEVFNFSNFVFVDGSGIIENPTREFQNLENYFGVEHQLEFEFNEEKGYPCLKRPIEMCLGADKGKNIIKKLRRKNFLFFYFRELEKYKMKL